MQGVLSDLWGYTQLAATPKPPVRPPVGAPVSAIVHTRHCHQHSRPMIKVTRIPDQKSKCGWWRRREGGPGPLHSSARMARRDCAAHDLHDGRAAQDPWAPSPGDGGSVGGVLMTREVWTRPLSPKRAGQLSLQNTPPCYPALLLTVPPPPPPSPSPPPSGTPTCTLCCGTPVAWQNLAPGDEGSDICRPSPTPGHTSSSWLPW